MGALALVLVLSSCTGGGAKPVAPTTTSSPTRSPVRHVVIGGVVGQGSLTVTTMMQQLYTQLLAHAGFAATIGTPADRATVFAQLTSGQTSVVPEYAAPLAQYLTEAAGGTAAAPVPTASTATASTSSTSTAPRRTSTAGSSASSSGGATDDAAATVAAAQPLARQRGVTLLKPAGAADEPAFAVSKSFAAQNKLTTLSDLGRLGRPVALAAPAECATLATCQPGLMATYGISVSVLLQVPYGSIQAKEAVASGAAQLVEVGTTDSGLSQSGLVVLTDDQHLQPADNFVPAANASLAAQKTFAKALDSLAPVLTTADLAQLVAQVDVQKLAPADVARSYLKDKNLI